MQKCRQSLEHLIAKASGCLTETEEADCFRYVVSEPTRGPHTYVIPKVRGDVDCDWASQVHMYLLIYVLTRHVMGKDVAYVNGRVREMSVAASERPKLRPAVTQVVKKKSVAEPAAVVAKPKRYRGPTTFSDQFTVGDYMKNMRGISDEEAAKKYPVHWATTATAA